MTGTEPAEAGERRRRGGYRRQRADARREPSMGLRYSGDADRVPRLRAHRWLHRARTARRDRSPEFRLVAWTPGATGSGTGRRNERPGRGRHNRRVEAIGADLVASRRPATRLPRRLLGELAAGSGRRAVAPRGGHHRRGQHEGGAARSRQRARPSVRRRPPDGRTGISRLRGRTSRPVRRSAVGDRAR